MECLRLGGDAQTGKKASSLGKLGELPLLSYTNLIEQAMIAAQESNREREKTHQVQKSYCSLKETILKTMTPHHIIAFTENLYGLCKPGPACSPVE